MIDRDHLDALILQALRSAPGMTTHEITGVLRKSSFGRTLKFRVVRAACLRLEGQRVLERWSGDRPAETIWRVL